MTVVWKYHARPSLVVITSASSLLLSLGGDGSGYCQRRDYAQQQTKRSRDPHVVLNVSANASRDEIKASFRSLAKRYHPDLRMHLHHHDTGNNNNGTNYDNTTNADGIMTELITAYETLMNKQGDGYSLLSIVDARDSRVALACETYTLMELRGMHRTFDIHTFRVDFSCSNDDADDNDDNDDDGNIMNTYTTCSTLDPYPILPLNVHPDDSISDLKRYIQARHGEEWGLSSIGGQRVDRDGLYLGWELVYYNSNSGDREDNDHDGYRSGNNKGYGKVLSYHLFLRSYNIKEGDHVHAIVRKRDI